MSNINVNESYRSSKDQDEIEAKYESLIIEIKHLREQLEEEKEKSKQLEEVCDESMARCYDAESTLATANSHLRDCRQEQQTVLLSSAKYLNNYQNVSKERDDLQERLADMEVQLRSERKTRDALAEGDRSLKRLIEVKMDISKELYLCLKKYREDLAKTKSELESTRTELLTAHQQARKQRAVAGVWAEAFLKGRAELRKRNDLLEESLSQNYFQRARTETMQWCRLVGDREGLWLPGRGVSYGVHLLLQSMENRRSLERPK